MRHEIIPRGNYKDISTRNLSDRSVELVHYSLVGAIALAYAKLVAVIYY